MTKLILFLEPAAAKFFRYHHDGVSMLRDPFRQLVLKLCEPHPSGLVKDVAGLERIETNLASENKRYGIDHRSCAIYINEKNMKLLNDALISTLEHEINTVVELYILCGKQIKEAFDYIIDKYDLDTTTDYSYDRMKKMNYRYREKQLKC